MDAIHVIGMHPTGERRVRTAPPPKSEGCGWYPIALAFHYQAYAGGVEVHRGTGETTEISSRAMRLRVPIDLPGLVEEVELAIVWPVALNGVTPLQWMVKARPVWRAPGCMFVCIATQELRTAGSRNRLAMAACG